MFGGRGLSDSISEICSASSLTKIVSEDSSETISITFCLRRFLNAQIPLELEALITVLSDQDSIVAYAEFSDIRSHSLQKLR